MMSDEIVWELRKGEVVLGKVTETLRDFPWINGQFEAAPDFKDYRVLFVEELRLMDIARDADKGWDKPGHDKAKMVAAWDAWDAYYENILALKLSLVCASKREQVKDPLLHIDGDKAWFRGILEDWDGQ